MGDGMDFWTAVKTCYGKYATFRGRALRSEFWYFNLFAWLVAIAALILDAALFGKPQGTLYAIVTLANLIPGIAVGVRRLHDTDRTGWWWWILLVPLIGIVLLLIWYCMRGTQGQNRFGSDPLNPPAHIRPVCGN
jgi:uncharacterized membrane protein YhaH (DUF805 family)